ncbi:competence protein ComEC [Bradyrhizobium sp. AUGA SZCCT0042]|uniref:competence protein ComEC n=1 Tax=Bradyrhizobium sp. AUGA SZCCT0042 TaxID=2807651 RepID=UPI001BABD32D|nr:competence protein ComEC [Bradyrhizobium sp. AUGA SZCCT0042]MBR1297379.1 competence protein ComEC [Bradyrhizobium sp. AUGA SZCCT0042]
MYEIDFLSVGNSNGDAICLQYSAPGGGVYVHVVDGAYTETGAKIVEHIRQYYGAGFFINHMVLSHADDDHATGLVEVIKNMRVQNLWMNRPWLYAAETVQHFHGLYTVEGLVNKMREMHPYLVDLEKLAEQQGTVIHDVFQGAQIGNFTVLAPSRERYIRLIPDLDKTPTRHRAADSLTNYLVEALKKARDYLYETWDIETLANDPDPTSASNETSVVQLGILDGAHVLLTGDVGPEGLNEAADYAWQLGLLQPPSFVQVPHHGSRRNVTPNVLDRWLGRTMEQGKRFGTAYCSVGDNKADYPRAQVSNAFLRRGYPVHVTRGVNKVHYSGSDGRGWGTSVPLPLVQEVEDKAKSAA